MKSVRPRGNPLWSILLLLPGAVSVVGTVLCLRGQDYTLTMVMADLAGIASLGTGVVAAWRFRAYSIAGPAIFLALARWPAHTLEQWSFDRTLDANLASYAEAARLAVIHDAEHCPKSAEPRCNIRPYLSEAHQKLAHRVIVSHRWSHASPETEVLFQIQPGARRGVLYVPDRPADEPQPPYHPVGNHLHVHRFPG